MTNTESDHESIREVDPRFAEYRRTGDRDLRNALVEDHVRLAEFLARRFQHRGEQLDDLRQVALVGLLKAVERFDPDRGLQFSSFATPTIVGELKRHFRDKGWAVHVPRRVQELHLELDHTVASLTQELRRPPSTAEIAARAGAWEEDVLEAMEANSLYRLPSIDAARTDDDTRATDERFGTEDEEFDAVDDRVAVRDLLAVLPARERKIVYLRFFEGRTQSEIASDVGISQMHVSRLLSKSLETLGAQRCPGRRTMTPSPLDHELPVIELAVTGPPSEPTLHVAGEIDVASAPLLREALGGLVDRGARRITLDLAAVGFIDSSGLGVLVGALRRLEEEAGGRLRVESVQDSVRKVFEITGLGPMFGLAPR